MLEAEVHVLASEDDRSKTFFREKHNNESVDPSSTKPISSKSLTMEFQRKMNSRKKIRRGYGKKNIRKNKSNEIKLSIIGTNSAGLKGKKETTNL